MRSFSLRAGRWSSVLLLAALNACADEARTTGPLRATTPVLAVGDVLLVTNTSDTGIGSLRWAIGQATGGEIIRFDPSLAGQTITLASTLVTTVPVTIEGPADRGITISGGGQVRVFEFNLNNATTTLRNLTVTGGKTSTGGSPAIDTGNDLLVENSTITGNEGYGYSAIRAFNTTLVNSTVSGNTSTIGVPAVSTSKLTLVNSTVAYNSAQGVGVSGTLVLRNSIIANNGTWDSCEGVTNGTYEGTNIVADTTCGGQGKVLIADPKLAPLADNGGPGRTHALLPGSPAINAATNCSVVSDQRYVARDAQCDPGAFEFTDFTGIAVQIDASAMVNPTTGWAIVTGSIQCTRDEQLSLEIDLEQAQKAGRISTVVQATGTATIDCTTTARPWSLGLVASNGVFSAGSATVNLRTPNTAAWVTPASATKAVRLFWGRK